MNDNVEYVKEILPTEELLCQLAEEAADLGHAALKLRRTMDGTNPTPVPYEEAFDNRAEEIADVLGTLRALELTDCTMAAEYSRISAEKFDRWAERLKKKYGEE